jgi:hypothetical protein
MRISVKLLDAGRRDCTAVAAMNRHGHGRKVCAFQQVGQLCRAMHFKDEQLDC